jgi:hypothetical protein
MVMDTKRMDLFGSDNKMNKISLFHASTQIRTIRDIEIPGPRNNCDFGSGFYLAASKLTAEEWVWDKPTPVINKFLFTENSSKILHLQGLDWVRVVVGFRTKKYKVKLNSPVVKGIIADDRMDISLPLFLKGEIGDQRLLKCLDFCKFGDQYLFRQVPVGLEDDGFYELKGQQKDMARSRNVSRKQEMENELQQIRRQPIPGELYIEDYIAKGDYIEP